MISELESCGMYVTVDRRTHILTWVSPASVSAPRQNDPSVGFFGPLSMRCSQARNPILDYDPQDAVFVVAGPSGESVCTRQCMFGQGASAAAGNTNNNPPPHQLPHLPPSVLHHQQFSATTSSTSNLPSSTSSSATLLTNLNTKIPSSLPMMPKPHSAASTNSPPPSSSAFMRENNNNNNNNNNGGLSLGARPFIPSSALNA